MKHCEIAHDLLPLYIEDMTSQASAEFIRDHLSRCKNCREEYERMAAPINSPYLKREQWKIAFQIEAKKQKRRKLTIWILSLLLSVCLVGLCLKNYTDKNSVTPLVIKSIEPEEILELCPSVVPTDQELKFLTWGCTLPILTNTSRMIQPEEFLPYLNELIPKDARIGEIFGNDQALTLDYFYQDQRILLTYLDTDRNGTFDQLEKYVSSYYFREEIGPFYSATYSTLTATTQYKMYE